MGQKCKPPFKHDEVLGSFCFLGGNVRGYRDSSRCDRELFLPGLFMFCEENCCLKKNLTNISEPAAASSLWTRKTNTSMSI